MYKGIVLGCIKLLSRTLLFLIHMGIKLNLLYCDWTSITHGSLYRMYEYCYRATPSIFKG